MSGSNFSPRQLLGLKISSNVDSNLYLEDEEITSGEASPQHDSGGQRLDRLLHETVEDVLKHIFSDETAILILRKVGEKGSLSLENLGSVEVFSDVMRRLLGSGSTIVEKLILKALFTRFELNFTEKEGYRLPDYIKELKEKCRY